MGDYFSTKQMYLKTERFVLRPFKMEDLNYFFEYSKVDGVFESAGMRHCQTIEDSKKRLEKYLYMENRFAVVNKDSNKVIGEV
jgi:ribosomal-protein-alanine N-acetyltransferase